ncbi:hypothetical protein [Acinetobacter guillouiae]|uniref:hypothetical protein n=1 Tax=Acinetobacter guillouiae TaxID=106649 RepID=UPI001AE77DDF|nr:hypothetical protein [Acinetobacter guillouiae]MBP2543184.1 hypothetical protein [Acinetobacter guillouiae]
MTRVDENNLPVAATLVLQIEEDYLDYILNTSNNWMFYFTEESAGITKIQVSIDFPSTADKEFIENFQSTLEQRTSEKSGEIIRLVYHTKKATK